MDLNQTYDRVRSAFADLRRQGYIARMDFADCMTCALAELPDPGKVGKKGAVYFHGQDRSRFFQTGELAIRYTPEVGGGHSRKLSVGEAVNRTLMEHGLRTEWSGNPDEVIFVKGDGA